MHWCIKPRRVGMGVFSKLSEMCKSRWMSSYYFITINQNGFFIGFMVSTTRVCHGSTEEVSWYKLRVLPWWVTLRIYVAVVTKLCITFAFVVIAFKDLTRHVMNSMMGYISLPAILEKIMQVCRLFQLMTLYVVYMSWLNYKRHSVYWYPTVFAGPNV